MRREYIFNLIALSKNRRCLYIDTQLEETSMFIIYIHTNQRNTWLSITIFL